MFATWSCCWGLFFLNRVSRYNSKISSGCCNFNQKAKLVGFSCLSPDSNNQDRRTVKQTLSGHVKEWGRENIMSLKKVRNTLFFTGAYFGIFVKCRSKFTAEFFLSARQFRKLQ